jgi:hypothetical protein
MKKIIALCLVLFVVFAFYAVSPAGSYASGFDENGMILLDNSDTPAPAPSPDSKTLVNRDDPFAIYGQNDE